MTACQGHTATQCGFEPRLPALNSGSLCCALPPRLPLACPLAHPEGHRYPLCRGLPAQDDRETDLVSSWKSLASYLPGALGLGSVSLTFLQGSSSSASQVFPEPLSKGNLPPSPARMPRTSHYLFSSNLITLGISLLLLYVFLVTFFPLQSNSHYPDCVRAPERLSKQAKAKRVRFLLIQIQKEMWSGVL